MIMKKIKDLNVGDYVDGFTSVITSIDVKKGKTGKFILLTLSDDSGNIDAVKWNFEEEPPKLYDTCVLGGEVQISNFTKKKQLVIHDLSWKTDLEVARKFMKHSVIAPNELYDKMESLLNEIIDVDLKDFCLKVHHKFEKEIKEVPAAVINHHDYYGGYAQHVFEVMSLSVATTKILSELSNYDYSMDLIIAGSYLHDLGKLKSYFLDGLEPSMTFEGKLNDHIGEGVLLLTQLAQELGSSTFNSKWLSYLTNVILTHHENLEWGSPIKPSYPEALIISRSDNMSASNEEMIKGIDEIGELELFENTKSYLFGTRLHRKKI